MDKILIVADCWTVIVTDLNYLTELISFDRLSKLSIKIFISEIGISVI